MVNNSALGRRLGQMISKDPFSLWDSKTLIFIAQYSEPINRRLSEGVPYNVSFISSVFPLDLASFPVTSLPTEQEECIHRSLSNIWRICIGLQPWTDVLRLFLWPHISHGNTTITTYDGSQVPPPPNLNLQPGMQQPLPTGLHLASQSKYVEAQSLLVQVLK